MLDWFGWRGQTERRAWFFLWQIGERENKVGLQRKNLVELRIDECETFGFKRASGGRTV